MLTARNFIFFGITLFVFGYAVWIIPQKSSDNTQFSKIEQIVGSVQKQPHSDEKSGIDKLTVMLKRVEKQYTTQQAQLKQQQVTINKLLVFIEEKSLFGDDSSISTDSSDLSNVEAGEEYLSQSIEQLDIEFDSEVIDQKWSKDAVDKVSDVLDKVMTVGSSITQLDCQSTVCKVALNHESQADMQAFMDNFMFELGWETNSIMQTSDNQEGDQVTVVYLSRDGYSLPEVY